MRQLQSVGKIFYGVGIAGIGVLQLIYPGFRPVLLPIPPEDTQHLNFLVYLVAVILVIAGLFIAFMHQVKPVAFGLGVFLLLFVIAGHLPQRLTNHPDILGAWTDALKLLALAGGAFMVVMAYPGRKTYGGMEKIARCGPYFFAVMLIIFGIDHFLYTGFVKPLVPGWIPGPLFWTYLAGVALMGAGLAILINFKPGIIGLLLAIMLLIWLIVLHIPRAIVAPATDHGNEWTSVFECLAFSGMALLYRHYQN
jgi:uncharacterized membrane protein YphA (DoxX/SURF4 family)